MNEEELKKKTEETSNDSSVSSSDAEDFTIESKDVEVSQTQNDNQEIQSDDSVEEPTESVRVGSITYDNEHLADLEDHMDWWPNLADLDRLNILGAPLEDRARLLASKMSHGLDSTMKEISRKTSFEYLEDFELPENPTKLLPLRLIHSFCCLPVDQDDDGKLKLVTAWPPSSRMSRWVYSVSGQKPTWNLGSPEKIARAITENFGIGADSLDESDLDADADDEMQDDLEDQNAAIIRFVNEVIQRAIVDRATDIHFEPHKDTLQIRYRIDGQLVPVRVPDNLRSFQDAIISRIKIMSGINISEKRRPQGGRITFSQGQSDLDIRVSTLPTLYGESISLRLLNEKSQPLSMQELGLLSRDEKGIVSILEKPHGIVLVTGPTGSGKSTSLTAFIRRIHKPERRIMTVEDPVEYEVAGINQTQVNSEIGFTFASALREILRQDPDVIMVGEIRDRETADIAIRASLTGHLVLSTLHTNDAPGAITRLIDMEIEPFLIASSVEMVIAQRLVRRLCPICAIPTGMSESELKASLSLLEVDLSEANYLKQVKESQGCPKCQNLGFRGRVGIFELMKMSDAIHGLVIQSASAPDIREVALKEGMTTLQGSGWSQIKRGLTTLDEVIRYADGMVDEAEEASVVQ